MHHAAVVPVQRVDADELPLALAGGRRGKHEGQVLLRSVRVGGRHRYAELEAPNLERALVRRQRVLVVRKLMGPPPPPGRRREVRRREQKALDAARGVVKHVEHEVRRVDVFVGAPLVRVRGHAQACQGLARARRLDLLQAAVLRRIFQSDVLRRPILPEELLVASLGPEHVYVAAAGRHGRLEAREPRPPRRAPLKPPAVAVAHGGTVQGPAAGLDARLGERRPQRLGRDPRAARMQTRLVGHEAHARGVGRRKIGALAGREELLAPRERVGARRGRPREVSLSCRRPRVHERPTVPQQRVAERRWRSTVDLLEIGEPQAY
mmetsp:Transcript_7101/g.19843  ORF Transcript_7101/g.19843 Transcript_7101/m.19843 type:complete len:322 (+) Transcript_7101:195-1160(+)